MAALGLAYGAEAGIPVEGEDLSTGLVETQGVYCAFAQEIQTNGWTFGSWEGATCGGHVGAGAGVRET